MVPALCRKADWGLGSQKRGHERRRGLPKSPRVSNADPLEAEGKKPVLRLESVAEKG